MWSAAQVAISERLYIIVESTVIEDLISFENKGINNDMLKNKNIIR